MPEKNVPNEKPLDPISGFPVLTLALLGIIASIAALIYALAHIKTTAEGITALIIVLAVVGVIVCIILMCGLKVINPNEAGVYVLFGSYYGTIAKPGFFWINPFCSIINPTINPTVKSAAEGASVTLFNKKVSLKATTLNNDRQKINDCEGNPIDIGVVVIWRVVNATRAVFEVDNYKLYVSIQCDAALRQVVRQYPYDVSEDGDETSLRGSSTQVAEELKRELQNRAEIAGVEIIEARISHLAYAQEIAAAMLQRQQANAVIAARQKIVEGAVGMVEMALNKLEESGTVNLDDERKAAMVSNLLVVLCGNRDAQPVVNSGSIY